MYGFYQISRMLMQHSAFLLRIYCLFLILSLTACSHLLFYPSRQIAFEANAISPVDERFQLTMKDGTHLSGLKVHAHQQPTLGAVIFFHGNSGNISTNLHHVLWLTSQGYDVLMFDYRGYGLSEGKVSLNASIDDIAEIIDWFNKQYSPHRRFVIAHSLGAAMTSYVLAEHSELREGLNGIILMGGFSAYKEIMRDVMARSFWVSWLRYPASLGMPNKYDAKNNIAAISPTPLLILHGFFDPVVPYKHAEILYQHAKDPKVLLTYPGFHNDPLDDCERQQQVLQFMQRGYLTTLNTDAALVGCYNNDYQ